MNSVGQKITAELAVNKGNEPLWLKAFIDNYQLLSTDNLHLLDDIYHQDIHFEDPMHCINGLTQLHQYFQQLYTNLESCCFNITNVLLQGEQAAIYWQMTYQHPKLNGGKPVIVEGHSHIKGSDDKVSYHRDYIDLGAMLYEHVPVLGRFIHWIKQRAAN